jgi:hypothetical protein
LRSLQPDPLRRGDWSPERDDDRDEDEREEFASRSIFSAGWFRAVLVLTVLAIVVVISLPYLLHWFEPLPPARVAKPAEPLKPAPGATPPPAVAPAPALARGPGRRAAGGQGGAAGRFRTGAEGR